MTKGELRKFIREQKALHKATTIDLSARIMQEVEADARFQAAHTILLYHSLDDEVGTHAFIEKWCTRKQLLLPVVVGDELELRIYQGAHELKVGSFGIAEPTGQLFTDYDQIDYAVVPGMAFDKDGNRLGRGKGYYDRLLPKLTHAYKVGICFPYQMVEIVPVEDTDVTMDEVLC